MAFLRAYMREGRCGKTTAPKGAMVGKEIEKSPKECNNAVLSFAFRVSYFCHLDSSFVFTGGLKSFKYRLSKNEQKYGNVKILFANPIFPIINFIP